MKLSRRLPLVLLATSLAFIGCKKKDSAATPPAESDKGAQPGATPTPSAPAPTPAPMAPATPPAAAAIASEADYVKVGVVLMDKMIDIFKAAGTNCDKLADDLTKLLADSDADFKATLVYEKAHPDAKQKFEAQTKDKTAAFEASAQPGLTACKDNKKLAQALTKLAPE
jgi:hypothetical protein